MTLFLLATIKICVNKLIKTKNKENEKDTYTKIRIKLFTS